jgi:hypothetical protein
MNRSGAAIVATLLLCGSGASSGQQSAAPSQSQQPSAAAATQANLSAVTRATFETWMTQLSNWGRWGKEDELGALNLITADKRKQAATLAKTGITVSLSRPIDRSQPGPSAEPRPVNRGGALSNRLLIEGGQIPGVGIPIHVFTLVALGVNLLDNLALDALAETASKWNRREFMLVVEPLRVQNGAGSAVNPIALFLIWADHGNADCVTRPAAQRSGAAGLAGAASVAAPMNINIRRRLL